MVESLLARVRRAAGLTQEELAERAGLSDRAIRSLEHGSVARPRRRTLTDLADALGLNDTDRERFIAHYRGHAPIRTVPDTAWSPGSPPASAGTADPMVRPAQLPAAPPALIGREPELDVLDRAATQSADHPVVVAITGIGGIGKTTLATAWGSQHRDQFPDGQLFANLAGFGTTEPLPPTAVLARFLTSLGVPADRLPYALDERTALFRSLAADRRLLILLDNARSAAQVRPLLPGAGRSLVLVTSRDRLRGLRITDAARRLELAPLDHDDAAAFFAEQLDDRQPDLAPEVIGSIVDQCAGLPLALALCGNSITGSGDPRRLAADLTEPDRLGIPGSGLDEVTNLESVFAASIAALTPPAARVFGYLGLHPGASFGDDAAAALVDQPVLTTRRLLAELVDAYLLQERPDGRYDFHDLLAKYARQLSRSEFTEAERLLALYRLRAYYLMTTVAARVEMGELNVSGMPVPIDPADVPSGRFADRDQAHRWLDAERSNLLALADTTPATDELFANQLSTALFRYFVDFGHFDDAIALELMALREAEALGDERLVGPNHGSLAVYYTLSGQLERGLKHQQLALEVSLRVGSTKNQIREHLHLGNVLVHIGRLTEARDQFDRGNRLADRDGTVYQRTWAADCLARAETMLGDFEAAATAGEHAVKLLEAVGDPADRSITSYRMHLVDAYRGLGRLDDADRLLATAGGDAPLDLPMLVHESHYYRARLRYAQGKITDALAESRRAVAQAQRIRDAYEEAASLIDLGMINLAVDDHDHARGAYRCAQQISSRIGSRFLRAQALLGLSRTVADPELAAHHRQDAKLIFDELAIPMIDSLGRAIAD